MKRLGLVLLVVCGCAHRVPQDSATGRDGKVKGAVPIRLDNGEGIASGIVTYPGGDRVDWRSIELPEGKAGTLDVAMTYNTPRPGLRVSFDVFDQYNKPITIQRAVAKHSREAKIDHAKGKYLIRVFAPGRGDAGTYKLKASFEEDPAPLKPDFTVAEPPKLPSVPLVVEECLAFDAHNPECANACPDDAPTNWKGCPKTMCRTPDVNNPACLHSMACPTPPDRRFDACMVKTQITKIWPACNPAARDPNNPRCDVMDPIAARIIHVEQLGDDVLITIGAGSSQNIDKNWRVTVLQGNSDQPVVGGTGTIVRLEKTRMTARVHLKREIVEANQNLRLSPP
jgi:hypothetical protein